MNTIRKYRLRKGLTVIELAELLGVSAPAVYQWEENRCKPTMSRGKKIGEILDFDWEEIYAKAETNGDMA